MVHSAKAQRPEGKGMVEILDLVVYQPTLTSYGRDDPGGLDPSNVGT